MGRDPDDSAVERLLSERGQDLMRAAVALTGYIPPAMAPGMPWAQGRVSWAVGTATIHGRHIYVQVDYRHHEWYPTPPLGFDPPPCTTRLDIVEFNGPANWASYLRQALSCGMFKVAGPARIDGEKTIKLTGSTTNRSFWAAMPHALGRGPLRVDASLYVDPKTYIPVLAIWENRTHWRDGRPMDGTVRQDISLLAPTPQNVAKASVTFPASFRRVPDSSFGGPVSPYFTRG